MWGSLPLTAVGRSDDSYAETQDYVPGGRDPTRFNGKILPLKYLDSHKFYLDPGLELGCQR